MSIVQYKRTPKEVIIGIKNRMLHIIAYFTFPYQVTVQLHRWRGVKIGKKTHIARLVSIDDRNPELIEIGDGVAISAGVMILAHQRDLSKYKPDMYAMHCPFKEGRVVIKDGAPIGIGTIIMPGVTIGEGAVIGAGAVVTKDIPNYCVAVGMPAKVIKDFRKINENLD